MFIERIKQLREERKLPLKKLAGALNINLDTCWKIEKSKHFAKKEQIPMTADILQADPDELLTLWLADQVAEVVANESLAFEALKVAEEKVKYNKTKIL